MNSISIVETIEAVLATLKESRRYTIIKGRPLRSLHPGFYSFTIAYGDKHKKEAK